jgi:N-acetylneuraminic acid mutarotase
VSQTPEVFTLRNKIYIWGGAQKWVSDFLPPNLVWQFTPSPPSWEKHETTGDVPPALVLSCSVVVDNTMYLFGGIDGSTKRAELYSFDGTRKAWRMMKSKGKSPSGRCGMVGFTDGKDPFYFGGYCLSDPNLLQGGDTENGDSNQVLRFSLGESTWFNVETKGTRPKPREHATGARLNDKLFVVGGGWSEGKMNDVWSLDVNNFEWTAIIPSNSLLPPVRWCHSVTVVDKTNLLLVGGDNGSSHYSDAWVLDTECNTWTKETDIPEEPLVGKVGLTRHKAVLCNKKVYLFGGARNDVALSKNIIILG